MGFKLFFLFLLTALRLHAQDATGYYATIEDQARIWKFSIKYNNTNYSYLTTAPFSDTDTEGFQAGSNPIAVETIVTDDFGGTDNANTGLAHDLVNDLILVKDFGPELVRFFDRDLNEVTTVNGHTVPVQVTGNQGIAYNFYDSTIYDFDLTNIKTFDLDGNLVASQNQGAAPSTYTAGGLFYNNFTGELYVSNVTSTKMRIYQRIGGVFVYVRETWYGVGEGITYDYTDDKVVTYLGDIWVRSYDGQYSMKWPLPTAGSEEVTEGIFADPRDGTYWFNSDEHFHGGIVNGNRIWHVDPKKHYGKYIRFPGMITYDLFKLPVRGEIVGTYNYQKVYADDWVISPVIDFESFTDQETEANWTSEDNFEIEWRGSTSAPSTSSIAGPPPHDLAFYNANQTNEGWGSVTPSGWSSTTVPTDQYVQFRIKPLEPTPPSSAWTPLSLGSKLKIWGTPRELTRVNKDSHTDTDVSLIFNRANADGGDGGMSQGGADSFKGQWIEEGTTSADEPEDRRGYVRYSGNRHHIGIGTIGGALETHTTGEWNIFGKRVTANTRAIWFSEMLTTTTNNQFRIFSFPSGGGTANWIGYQILDGTGAVTLTCGLTHSTTNWEMLTFGSDGAELYLYIDNVKQTLTFSTGSNTGQWYGTVAGDQVAIGLLDTSGSSVTGDTGIRDYIYTDPLTTQERTDYFNYGTALGYR